MGATDEIFMECHCLWSEIDRAIPAIFELPGVPVGDAQIARAVRAVKLGADVISATLPLRFKARYDRDAGTLVIFQVLHGNRSPRTIVRRNQAGHVEFLEPLWGLKGISSTIDLKSFI